MVASGRQADFASDDILYLFFTESEGSRAAGRASLGRMSRPDRAGSAVKTTPETMRAQLQAIIGFYKNEGDWYGRLGEIASETLVANGDRDGAFPVIDSVDTLHLLKSLYAYEANSTPV